MYSCQQQVGKMRDCLNNNQQQIFNRPRLPVRHSSQQNFYLELKKDVGPGLQHAAKGWEINSAQITFLFCNLTV